jgi:cytochrome c556
MRKRIAWGVAIALVGFGVARADGLDPISVRQTGMDLAGGDFAFVRAVVAAKGDVKPLEAPAKAISRWAGLIPAVFPVGSDQGGNTKALAEIWSDRPGFEKNAAAMGAAADRLAVAAKAGDADAAAVEAKALGEQCGGCHRHYRAK